MPGPSEWVMLLQYGLLKDKQIMSRNYSMFGFLFYELFFTLIPLGLTIGTSGREKCLFPLQWGGRKGSWHFCCHGMEGKVPEEGDGQTVRRLGRGKSSDHWASAFFNSLFPALLAPGFDSGSFLKIGLPVCSPRVCLPLWFYKCFTSCLHVVINCSTQKSSRYESWACWLNHTCKENLSLPKRPDVIRLVPSPRESWEYFKVGRRHATKK